MKKLGVMLFLSLTALISIGLMGTALYLYQHGPQQHKQNILDFFEAKTGINLQVEEKIKVKLHPIPEFTLNKVTLHFENKNHHYELKAEKFQIKAGWQLFLNRKWSVHPIKLTAGKLCSTALSTPIVFDKITANLNLKNEKQIKLEQLEIINQQENISGVFDVLIGSKIKINGHLRLKHWTQSQGDNFNLADIKDTLKNLLIDVNMMIEKIKINHIDFKNVRFNIKSDGQKISLKNIKAQLGGGKFEGNFDLKYNKKRPLMTVDVFASQVPAHQIMKFPVKSFIGGKSSLKVSGQAYGQTIDQWLNTFNGDFSWNMGQSSFKHDKIKTSEGFFLSILSMVFLGEKEKTTALTCVATKAKIVNGVAYFNPGIGIKTKKANFYGGGTLSLLSKAVDFEIGVDHKSLVSLQVGPFDNLIRITGTLNQPIVKRSNISMVQESGSVLAAILTGGVSLVAQKALSEIQKINHPCLKVQTGAPKGRN